MVSHTKGRGETFLCCIITTHERWTWLFEPELNQQNEWWYPESPWPKKINQVVARVMLIVASINHPINQFIHSIDPYRKQVFIGCGNSHN
jgi:hypothetical protein